MIHHNLAKIPVVVLCGGLGSRLAKYIPPEIPKALALINGVPFLDYQLAFFYKNNIRNFFYLLGHGADKIIEHLNDLKKNYPNCSLNYVVEKHPLGTGGALINCLDLINHEYFILINGDTYIECDLINFFDSFSRSLPTVMMGIAYVSSEQKYGYVEFDSNNKLIDITYQSKDGGYINSGVFIFNKKKIQNQKLIKGTSYSLEQDLILRFKKDVYVYDSINSFLDIGTENSYNIAKLLLKL